jgi:hypothetical protein
MAPEPPPARHIAPHGSAPARTAAPTFSSNDDEVVRIGRPVSRNSGRDVDRSRRTDRVWFGAAAYDAIT